MSSREEKTENLKRSLLDINNYNRPMICQECGGVFVFKGVGEYKCEDCGAVEYDDYGKARNYLEKHTGATAAQVSEATGVSQKSIREMLKEDRLEIAPNSNAFLTCEICGKPIRSGRYCSRCESAYHKEIEEKARAARNINLSGFGAEKSVGEEGAKRFTRER
ncbi:MAG: hypothetical protein NC416_10175 [Eubacterium sp.]|nr:hypothetical protein [Eubacterium sp.]